MSWSLGVSSECVHDTKSCRWNAQPCEVAKKHHGKRVEKRKEKKKWKCEGRWNWAGSLKYSTYNTPIDTETYTNTVTHAQAVWKCIKLKFDSVRRYVLRHICIKFGPIFGGEDLEPLTPLDERIESGLN